MVQQHSTSVAAAHRRLVMCSAGCAAAKSSISAIAYSNKTFNINEMIIAPIVKNYCTPGYPEEEPIDIVAARVGKFGCILIPDTVWAEGRVAACHVLCGVWTRSTETCHDGCCLCAGC